MMVTCAQRWQLNARAQEASASASNVLLREPCTCRHHSCCTCELTWAYLPLVYAVTQTHHFITGHRVPAGLLGAQT